MMHQTPELPDIGLPGPETLATALRAIVAEDRRASSFLAVKEALLPPTDLLHRLLADLSPAARILLRWLQPASKKRTPLPPAWDAGLRWLKLSNVAAATEAYAHPDWWDAWISDGWPAAREALGWLLALEPPDDATAVTWGEAHLVTDLSGIRANSLLLLAASNDGRANLLALAEEEHPPAIRALALLPGDDSRITEILFHVRRAGTRTGQDAANCALNHLARRHGFPDAAEFERQHLLASAWDDTFLANERVRVGWQHGSCRLRVSLRAGRAQLEVLGPLGVLKRIPDDLRHSDEYREARETQRQLDERYRLFKPYIEETMLTARPLSLGQFRHLYTHPVFAHLAERVVWGLPDGSTMLWAGPGQWESLTGDAVDLTGDVDALTLTVLHPIRLAESDLAAWQAIAAERRLVQPIRQLFREIYTFGDDAVTQCTRFAGCRLVPQRAYALLRAANFAPGNGTARRIWPGGITAHLVWADGARGRDLFGPHRADAVTTGAIYFTRDGAELPFSRVEPITISETLRVADLLTTRAAAGDADMTARETVALRASLLRQIARSFDLTNVVTPEDGRYALVLGTHADYRINLANGTVMLEPDGRQLILPPIAARWQLSEEKDATSDILAAVLLLANDAEIADITFIAQLPANR